MFIFRFFFNKLCIFFGLMFFLVLLINCFNFCKFFNVKFFFFDFLLYIFIGLGVGNGGFFFFILFLVEG